MKIIEPKILKGTQEFGPEEMAKRNYVMTKLREIFDRFGYGNLETPILCPAETILGKYGEEGDRLTYSFKDNGDRDIALPYDLTVPFARYFAANWGTLALPFKRYQIQRVWRAEKPQKGRMREFYQCDIDVIGTESLLVDAEIVKVIYTVFSELEIGSFTIKFNSRALINEVLGSFGIMSVEDRVRVIRILDKLDKIGEDGVKELLQKEFEGEETDSEFAAALAGNEIDQLWVDRLLDLLKDEETLDEVLGKLADFDLSKVVEFLDYLESLGVPTEFVQFSPALARGLDYYTGLIFETVSNQVKLGSICGGGRYDNLCGTFTKQEFSGIGVSFGFERIMIILEELGIFEKLNLNAGAKCLVTIFDQELVDGSLEIYKILNKNKVAAEIYFEPAKLGKQFKYADRKGIPYVIVQGPDEKKANEVVIKEMESGKEKKVNLEDLADFFI